MVHETDEDLSALLDGELTAPDTERARSHAASCAECGARLAKLIAASELFKRSGEAAAPAGLAARAKAGASRRPMRTAARLAAFIVVGLGLALVAGGAMKKFLPTLFSRVQGMISGAASQAGEGH